MEIIGDLIPPGVVNVITGFGKEAGQALAESSRIQKLAFTGSTATGEHIMKSAAKNIVPVTLELGGKSPLIFMPSVMDQDDEFLDKCLEAACMFALNQGEVCTCPSRMLIHESIYDKLMPKIIERVKKIKIGHPLDPSTMLGAQASKQQLDKIESYLNIGKAEGAQVLTGGNSTKVVGDGYYVQPTIFKGTNNMRVFQEEIFGPVVGATTFRTTEECLQIANDTTFGLGAGLFTRDAHEIYKIPRAIQAGRVWVNCYHLYPAGAPFGGYKKSGIGRENHKMMLSSYRQSKNMLISYDKNKLGFF